MKVTPTAGQQPICAKKRALPGSACGMIGGDGINDESNKMSPAPDTQIYLTKDTGFSPNAELANRMLVKAAEGFFGRMKVEAFYPEH